MNFGTIIIKLCATVFLCCLSFCSYSQSGDTNGVAAFRVGKKWGIIDHHGLVISTPKYDGIIFYKNIGLYYENGKRGLLRADGKVLTQAIYDDIDLGGYGMYGFLREGKWGYLDNEGVEKIPPKYVDHGIFHEDRAIVSIGDNHLLIDREGKTIAKLEGLRFFLYSKDSIYVCQDSSAVLIDHDGKIVKTYPFFICWVDGTYMTIETSYYSYYGTQKGLADMNGQIVIPMIYTDIIAPDTSLILVHKKDLTGYVDKYNREIIPLGKYEYIDIFWRDNVYAEYKKNGKVGFVSRSGKEMGIEFEETRYFSFGIADVKQNGKWGCIDTSGNWIISCKYDDVYSLGANLFWVKKGKKWQLINREKKKVCKRKFDTYGVLGGADPIASSRIIVVKNGKYGVIDVKGNFIVKPIYDEIGLYSWY